MTNEDAAPVEPKPGSKRKPIALIGAIVGFIALCAAFLSPWIAEAIDPPPPPQQETDMVEFAISFGKAIKEGTQVETPPRQRVPSDFLPPAVIGLGMIGAGLGLISIFVQEPWQFGTCAMGLGVAAAVVQWSIIIFAAMIGLLLLLIILAALGIDFSPA